MLRRNARDAKLKHDSPQRAASHLERKKSLTRIASSEKSVMRRREDLSLPRSERGPLPLSAHPGAGTVPKLIAISRFRIH